MRRRLTALIVVLAGLALVAGPARADLAQPRLVSVHPAGYTPNVLDGTVHTIAVVGTTVVAGGDFTLVADARRTTRYARRSLFAFDLRSGAVTGFAPRLDGVVNAVTAGPDGTVYVGGRFRTVNGVHRPGLVQLSVATGAIVAGFTPTVDNGEVRTLAVHGPWLYAGGSFGRLSGVTRAGLARLAAGTGAVDRGFDLRLRGAHGPAKVDVLRLTADGSRLALAGDIAGAAGQNRAQLVLVDLAGGPARLSGWYTTAYAAACSSDFDTYVRGLDFAPDGSYLVVVTTGHNSGPQLICDTAARFNLGGTGRHDPVWVNHTGGNTLWSVSVTGPAVYVGGHQQWVDNPYGHKTAGRGAVSRPGIAALDPATGHALAWNPTHGRGVGVQALVSCPQGLLVGSDTDQMGHEYHGRIGLLPTG